MMKVYRTGAIGSVYDTDLEVNWVITSMCNYKCSYCFGQDTIRTKEFSSFSQLKNAVDYVKRLKRSAYTVTLAGGEPTIHPEYLNLVGYICNEITNLQHIITVTNGSRNVDFYKKLIPYSRNTKLKLTISCHFETVKIDHIIDIIKNLSDDITLDLKLMFHPEKRDTIQNACNTLIELRKIFRFRCNVCLLRMAPNFDVLDSRYEDDDYKWCNEMNRLLSEASDNAEREFDWHDWDFFYDVFDGQRTIINDYDYNSLLETGMGDFHGMYCIPETSVLYINPDGIAKGANCPAVTKTYNLYDGQPGINMSPYMIKCPLDGCGCKPNHTIPKFLDKQEAESYIAMYLKKMKRLDKES